MVYASASRVRLEHVKSQTSPTPSTPPPALKTHQNVLVLHFVLFSFLVGIGIFPNQSNCLAEEVLNSSTKRPASPFPSPLFRCFHLLKKGSDWTGIVATIVLYLNQKGNMYYADTLQPPYNTDHKTGCSGPPATLKTFENDFASQIESRTTVLPQSRSPLFAKLPRECRDLIWKSALRSFEDEARPYPTEGVYCRPGRAACSRIATELLLTCRAVYLETFHLPLALNPVVQYVGGCNQTEPPGYLFKSFARAAWARGEHVVQGERMKPWQHAFLKSRDLAIQQECLESCRDYTTFEGFSIIMPQLYAAFHRNKIPIQVRPNLNSLTIRLSATDWWTWAEAPDAPEQLALDPNEGDGTFEGQPTAEKMIENAQLRRRDELYESSVGTWGSAVSKCKSLKYFEIELETFALKRDQLETIVECAKTWKFPLDEDFELKYRGPVDAWSWKGNEWYQYHSCCTWLTEEREAGPFANDFEVRSIKFARCRRERQEERYCQEGI